MPAWPCSRQPLMPHVLLSPAPGPHPSCSHPPLLHRHRPAITAAMPAPTPRRASPTPGPSPTPLHLAAPEPDPPPIFPLSSSPLQRKSCRRVPPPSPSCARLFPPRRTPPEPPYPLRLAVCPLSGTKALLPLQKFLKTSPSFPILDEDHLQVLLYHFSLIRQAPDPLLSLPVPRELTKVVADRWAPLITVGMPPSCPVDHLTAVLLPR
jgi:hypothetical protein